MALNDEQLGAILQGTRDFAVEMLEELELFTPFGAKGLPDGTLEFFAFPPKSETTAIEELYREVRSALVDSACNSEIIAGVIVANVLVPDHIDSALSNAIGMHIEAPGYCRFVYATYELRPDTTGVKKSRVELGEMIPIEVAPAIFVQ